MYNKKLRLDGDKNMNEIKHLEQFYVYRHIRLDSGLPFYVGKGSKDRAFDLRRRNQFHKNIADKHGCRIEIVKYFDDEKSAYDFEDSLIKLYKSFGLCKANIANGGYGLSGYSHKRSDRIKMSKKASAYWTKENKRKASLAKQEYIWITPAGEFETAQQAADFHRISRSTLRNRMRDYNEWTRRAK